MGAERRRPPVDQGRHYVWCGVAAILLVAASWWQGSHAPLPKAIDAACDARCAAPKNGTLAAGLDDAAAAAQRKCAERSYRCGDATLIFVHVHKGGGTTLVDMARGNRAGLARVNRNGDPELGGRRVPWWTMGASEQARWFATNKHRFIRGKQQLGRRASSADASRQPTP